MFGRLGLGKQTNMWRTRVLGWLYRHDWHLAGLLAIAIIAMAAVVLWPRPVSVTMPPAGISADDVEAAQEKTVIVYVGGAVRTPRLDTRAATARASAASG